MTGREISETINSYLGTIALGLLLTIILGFMSWLGITMNQHGNTLSRLETTLIAISNDLVITQKTVNDVNDNQRKDELAAAQLKQQLEDSTRFLKENPKP